PLRLVPTAPAPPATYTLSLHDALPISDRHAIATDDLARLLVHQHLRHHEEIHGGEIIGELAILIRDLRDHHVDDVIRHVVVAAQDRKSTRLNSSHVKISYAVFCLKKKK